MRGPAVDLSAFEHFAFARHEDATPAAAAPPVVEVFPRPDVMAAFGSFAFAEAAPTVNIVMPEKANLPAGSPELLSVLASCGFIGKAVPGAPAGSVYACPRKVLEALPQTVELLRLAVTALSVKNKKPAARAFLSVLSASPFAFLSDLRSGTVRDVCGDVPTVPTSIFSLSALPPAGSEDLPTSASYVSAYYHLELVLENLGRGRNGKTEADAWANLPNLLRGDRARALYEAMVAHEDARLRRTASKAVPKDHALSLRMAVASARTPDRELHAILSTLGEFEVVTKMRREDRSTWRGLLLGAAVQRFQMFPVASVPSGWTFSVEGGVNLVLGALDETFARLAQPNQPVVWHLSADGLKYDNGGLTAVCVTPRFVGADASRSNAILLAVGKVRRLTCVSVRLIFPLKDS